MVATMAGRRLLLRTGRGRAATPRLEEEEEDLEPGSHDIDALDSMAAAIYGASAEGYLAGAMGIEGGSAWECIAVVEDSRLQESARA
jgi:hypothetical protein